VRGWTLLDQANRSTNGKRRAPSPRAKTERPVSELSATRSSRKSRKSSGGE
jgi:hypothetical protein